MLSVAICFLAALALSTQAQLIFLNRYGNAVSGATNLNCHFSAQADEHLSVALTEGVCSQSPYNASLYQQVSLIEGDVYQFLDHCSDDTCGSCEGTGNLTVGSCTLAFNNQSSVLLTTSQCQGGVDATSNSVGVAWNLVYANASCPANTTERWVNLANSAECQELGSGFGFGWVVQNGDGSYNASLLCSNSTCASCTVNVENIEAGQCILAESLGVSWSLAKLGALGSCGAPGSSASKLSTGAIAGIAAGAAVGVILIVAVGTYLVKAKGRRGYKSIDE